MKGGTAGGLEFRAPSPLPSLRLCQPHVFDLVIARVAHRPEPGAAASAVIPKLGHRACAIVADIGVVEEGRLGIGRRGIGTLQVGGAEIGELARLALTAIRAFDPHTGLYCSLVWAPMPFSSSTAPWR